MGSKVTKKKRAASCLRSVFEISQKPSAPTRRFKKTQSLHSMVLEHRFMKGPSEKWLQNIISV
jgi:hypothetical protein